MSETVQCWCDDCGWQENVKKNRGAVEGTMTGHMLGNLGHDVDREEVDGWN